MIRGDTAARAFWVDEMDHDAVVLQRRTDLRNWVDGHEDADGYLVTQLGVASPVDREGEAEVDKGRRRCEDIVDRRGWAAGATKEMACCGSEELGRTQPDVVSPALPQYGTRAQEEEAEVGVTRVRQLQGIGMNNVEVDEASPVGETGRGPDVEGARLLQQYEHRRW